MHFMNAHAQSETPTKQAQDHLAVPCACGCGVQVVLPSAPEDTQLTNKERRGPVATLLVGLVRFYQRRISPLTPPACRFSPTCSEYMRQSLVRHGALKGTWLGTRRLLRCHPFHPGGYDPVP